MSAVDEFDVLDRITRNSALFDDVEIDRHLDQSRAIDKDIEVAVRGLERARLQAGRVGTFVVEPQLADAVEQELALAIALWQGMRLHVAADTRRLLQQRTVVIRPIGLEIFHQQIGPAFDQGNDFEYDESPYREGPDERARRSSHQPNGSGQVLQPLSGINSTAACAAQFGFNRASRATATRSASFARLAKRRTCSKRERPTSSRS